MPRRREYRELDTKPSIAEIVSIIGFLTIFGHVGASIWDKYYFKHEINNMKTSLVSLDKTLKCLGNTYDFLHNQLLVMMENVPLKSNRHTATGTQVIYTKPKNRLTLKSEPLAPQKKIVHGNKKIQTYNFHINNTGPDWDVTHKLIANWNEKNTTPVGIEEPVMKDAIVNTRNPLVSTSAGDENLDMESENGYHYHCLYF